MANKGYEAPIAVATIPTAIATESQVEAIREQVRVGSQQHALMTLMLPATQSIVRSSCRRTPSLPGV